MVYNQIMHRETCFLNDELTSESEAHYYVLLDLSTRCCVSNTSFLKLFLLITAHILSFEYSETAFRLKS